MSVTTTADEARRRLRDYLDDESYLNRIKQELDTMCNPDVWGSNEWSADFLAKIEEDLETITTIQRTIRKLKQQY